uniref:Tudor domain containing 6 n=1 Tax=Malurus cyaneus samueli TaxID=2593467 RepID=A0A8C5X195_9PASS
MSSGLGPLGRGDTVTLRVRAVGLYPEVPILQLWGLLGERKADYAGLYREIQAAAGPRLAARPEPSGPGVSGTRLCPGELALVEVLGVWYRCCVVSCSAQGYRVFLLDEGYVVATSAYYLAQGCSELFQLPPEVLGCVVADVMPSHGHEGTACGDSPVSKWTVEAMEFLSFLHGKEVSGVVQEVMMPQLIVLELPQLVAQMRQLGLAKRVSPSWFCQVLRRCLPFGQLKKQFCQQPLSCSLGTFAVPQLLHVLLSYQPLSPALDYYYPQLQLGVTEPVIVTHVSDPHHIYLGSTVNVILSYVENPSCFWCQLSRNCHDLEVLMDEIQEHCKNASQPHVWPNLVCLAQYSEDKKWYRALIVSEGVCAEKVEVIYVDYGNREQVCLTKLRAINEHFLRLEAQAFRCSLYNLIQPNGQNPFAWDEEAMQAFRQFVVDSSSDRDLKCTIFALASINRDLFNIVDLITPFQSACQFLTERGVARPLFPQKHMESLVQLHSYYYSSHGIKIGSEEDVYVTHVENPWTFYCQLERCADTLAQLADSISRLSERVTSTGTSGKSGNLCLARYSDSQWYRGVIMERQPKTKVFFVDFGNTETIETDDLLLVPNDASDILLVPMQAIRCSVSDLSSVSKEAATWFKEAVLERRLKAIVVAKDSDNTLLVELFDRNTQINTKLKELSLNSTGLCSYVHNETSCSRNADVNESIKTEGRCGTLKTLVYVSYVNDPQDFYVQLGSDEVQLNNILESLNNGKSVKDPCGQLFQVGDLISAVYSEDSRWYRAVVKEKTSHNLIRVHYIDYGDTSVISVDQARRLPKDLSSIPAMSIHCFLGGVKCKNNADWTEKAVFYFTKRTSEILLSCEFVKKVEDKWEVILSDHQGIITMDLVDKDIASRERLFSRKRIDKRENRDMITVCDPLPPQVQNEICVSDCKSFIWIFPEVGQTLKIYVTVVSGPGCFWCHRADTKDISNIEKKIEEAEKLGLSSLNNGKSHIKNGDACLAKYSQDGWFYRAQVRSVKDDSVVVRHVDYGSEETVSLEKIRQMPCELLRVPGQAFACCLSGFSPSEGSWLSEANKKFYDLTENLVLEAEVQLVFRRLMVFSGNPFLNMKHNCRTDEFNFQICSLQGVGEHCFEASQAILRFGFCEVF